MFVHYLNLILLNIRYLFETGTLNNLMIYFATPVALLFIAWLVRRLLYV